MSPFQLQLSLNDTTGSQQQPKRQPTNRSTGASSMQNIPGRVRNYTFVIWKPRLCASSEINRFVWRSCAKIVAEVDMSIDICVCYCPWIDWWWCIILTPSLPCTPSLSLSFGAVHKVRHAIFVQFWPPLPSVTFCHTSRDPPKYVTHLGPPRFLAGLVQKTRTKAPCTNSLWIVREGFCPGAFVRGSFVWKVLFGVVFIRSPFVRIHLLQVTTES